MEDKAKAKKIRDILFWSIIAMAIVGGGLYQLGYRFSGKIGKVSINVPYNKTSIFVDESKKIETSKDSELVELSLSPGKHQIIVTRDGYYPWIKQIKMPSGGEIDLSPFIIFQNTSGVIITKSDPEYSKIRDSITANKLRAKEKPLVSKDGSMEVWVEDNTIMSKKGGAIHTIVKPETPIRNVDFYKNRSDVVIFSVGEYVNVIEIGAEGTQNFMPIYKGINPSFITADLNSIYVLDGEKLMQVLI